MLWKEGWVVNIFPMWNGLWESTREMRLGIRVEQVLPLDMVDKSPSLSKPIWDWFFDMLQSREAFSSQSEAPSELLCGSLHPFPCDMRLHPPLTSIPLKRKPLQ